jgi:hypothetical protein
LGRFLLLKCNVVSIAGTMYETGRWISGQERELDASMAFVCAQWIPPYDFEAQ